MNKLTIVMAYIENIIITLAIVFLVYHLRSVWPLLLMFGYNTYKRKETTKEVDNK